MAGSPNKYKGETSLNINSLIVKRLILSVKSNFMQVSSAANRTQVYIFFLNGILLVRINTSFFNLNQLYGYT
ncbi:hypothetical protein SAMN06269250_5019 [Spirosoma fluviale]|uniref:Uncharacterized protein n=1 Tax=Spirosoma fluviale TaxID=1597977 RepID=A0A286GK37_9BACT|nr:hypothetical protein SAMN06269250_5019 [Spirosoma fluviale]